MRIEIEIPKEFEKDYNEDKFDEFFGRVLCDIADGTMCGRYEKETAQMLLNAFSESKPAYDVEAVVAELEKLQRHTWGVTMLTAEDYVKVSDLRKVIEIVRGKE